MGITWNPFNPGGIDFTGSGGGGGGPAERFVQTFDGGADWGSPSGGVYSITVPAATHALGTNPNVQVYELIGGVYNLVNISINVTAAGAVTISVVQTPDLRFPGLILII